MNTLHHLLYASALANGVSRSRRERRIIMLAAIVPDVDGVTIWNRELWESVHRTFGHNVFFAGAVVGTAFVLGRSGRNARLAMWCAVSIFLLHFGLDLLANATYPIRPLWPFSMFDLNFGNFTSEPERLDWWLRVPVQYGLMVVGVALLVRTYRRHGRTALELFSYKLDELLAGYVARMLSGKRCAECGARAGFRCAACHDPICGNHAKIRGLEPTCAHCQESVTVAPS